MISHFYLCMLLPPTCFAFLYLFTGPHPQCWILAWAQRCVCQSYQRCVSPNGQCVSGCNPLGWRGTETPWQQQVTPALKASWLSHISKCTFMCGGLKLKSLWHLPITFLSTKNSSSLFLLSQNSAVFQKHQKDLEDLYQCMGDIFPCFSFIALNVFPQVPCKTALQMSLHDSGYAEGSGFLVTLLSFIPLPFYVFFYRSEWQCTSTAQRHKLQYIRFGYADNLILWVRLN